MVGPVTNLPPGWQEAAHVLWEDGRRQEAINVLLEEINAQRQPPAENILQFIYYLFTLNDFRSAAQFLALGRVLYPEDLQILLNLGVALNRAGNHSEALAPLEKYLCRGGQELVALDALASSHHILGNLEAASKYGRASLEAKDKASRVQRAPLRSRPADVAARPKIIAFVLWGSAPRYLRGALQNALSANKIYPGWVCRFWIDSSVPADLVNALRSTGAEIVECESTEPIHRRLCRRFLISDDDRAGYFLVRDCDSVISEREAAAVADWLSSGKSFHVMRDWWTHTDTMLAGMWGGTAGMLSPMRKLIDSYACSHVMTSNWDQWFLRDCVWGSIRNDCLVHDRFYRATGGIAFRGADPGDNRHVGQDEFAARRLEQEKFLADWRDRVPSLRLPGGPHAIAPNS